MGSSTPQGLIPTNSSHATAGLVPLTAAPSPRNVAGQRAKPEVNGAGLRSRMETGLGSTAALTKIAPLAMLEEMQIVAGEIAPNAGAVAEGYKSLSRLSVVRDGSANRPDVEEA